jgi:hypothetical protein
MQLNAGVVRDARKTCFWTPGICPKMALFATAFRHSLLTRACSAGIPFILVSHSLGVSSVSKPSPSPSVRASHIPVTPQDPIDARSEQNARIWTSERTVSGFEALGWGALRCL